MELELGSGVDGRKDILFKSSVLRLLEGYPLVMVPHQKP